MLFHAKMLYFPFLIGIAGYYKSYELLRYTKNYSLTKISNRARMYGLLDLGHDEAVMKGN